MSGKIYEKRAQLETRSPLTLVTTLEVDDIPTVELAMTYDDGSKEKVKVPTHDLESVEQVLYCFHEFLEAARKSSSRSMGLSGLSSIVILCADTLARRGI